MSFAQASTPLTAAHAIEVVKRLPPTELRKFTKRFTRWRKPDHKERKEVEEKPLLASIAENSHLPADSHRRYEQLRRKCERRMLTEGELAEYQSLLQQLEARNVKRIEALSILARQRKTTLRGLIADLGVRGLNDAD